jgi:membrane-anchored protein YejM (alkaline phosphatase superfamily)
MLIPDRPGADALREAGKLDNTVVIITAATEAAESAARAV